MIRTLHFLCAMAAAILAECILGNFHIRFPLSVCVLWFIGRKLPFSALLGTGVVTGLFFDLLYFHPQPHDLVLFGAALTAAWLIEQKMSWFNRFVRLMLEGAVLGIFIHGGNILLVPAGDRSTVLFRAGTLFTIFGCSACLLLFQLLSAGNGKRNVPRGEKKPPQKKTAVKKRPENSTGKRKKA